ncbi:MAG: hypothetical protein PHS02_03465, partial [Candidatus ainarchaeum sp.]|nr:hypothetical protein [Candidatus ainarchaeum sp.]
MSEPGEIRRTMRDSVVEGSFANIMEYAGRAFLLPMGVALGATISQLSVLTSLPYLLTGLGGEVTASFRNLVKNRAKVLFSGAALQAVAWLILSILSYSAASSASREVAVLLLILVASVIYLLDAVLQPIWFSLFGDVVPVGQRSRWLGRRNQIMFMAALICLGASGVILNLFPPAQVLYGFSIRFLIASLARFASAFLLKRHYEPRKRRSAPGKEGGTVLPGFLAVTFILNFVVYFASPFFNIHMLENLNFDYLSYSLVLAVQILFAVLAYPGWGIVISKYGGRQVLIANGFLSIFVPLFWLHINTPFEALFAEAFSGLVWSGINLAAFDYLFEISKSGKEKRFAHRNLAFNGGIFLGTISGGAALAFLISSGFGYIDAFKVVFVLSALGRLALFSVAGRFLPRLANVERI